MRSASRSTSRRPNAPRPDPNSAAHLGARTRLPVRAGDRRLCTGAQHPLVGSGDGRRRPRRRERVRPWGRRLGAGPPLVEQRSGGADVPQRRSTRSRLRYSRRHSGCGGHQRAAGTTAERRARARFRRDRRPGDGSAQGGYRTVPPRRYHRSVRVSTVLEPRRPSVGTRDDGVCPSHVPLGGAAPALGDRAPVRRSHRNGVVAAQRS